MLSSTLITLIATIAQCNAQGSFNPFTSGGNKSALLDPHPVGLSIEFFTFPSYFQEVTATTECIRHLDDAAGNPTPLRIGGTTQDRATYVATQSEAVLYSVSDPKNAPDTLTFGPSFFTLAGGLKRNTTVGLNRRLNDIANTIAAAQEAVKQVPNLFAIELGNEPDLFNTSDPIAIGGVWNADVDAASQVKWQNEVSTSLGKPGLISAGVFSFAYTVANLASKEGDSIKNVKTFCGHNYPQSACKGAPTNLKNLFDHPTVLKNVAAKQPEVDAARSLNKEYVLGETNSATCGGSGISPTFGAALWLVDYVLSSTIVGVKQLFFHQGTLGNCPYCLWGRFNMGTPYYGAVFVTEALRGATNVAMMDDGTSTFAAYTVFDKDTPIKVVLINSEYFDAASAGARPSYTYTLTGLTTKTVKAKRLSGKFATSRQDEGDIPTWAGQSFEDKTCAIKGTEEVEAIPVEDGSATFKVAASEALLVIL